MLHSLSKFRSTPPRGGRPLPRVSRCEDREVSIHAPARGATGAGRQGRPQGAVSIHAPARGATWPDLSLARGAHRFDPRPREGGDPIMCGRRRTRTCFDPRPREGGRRGRLGVIALGMTFRSTPPRGGGDMRWSAIVSRQSVFRSTPPRGGRPRACPSTTSFRCFDPRPREGGDGPPWCRPGRARGFDPRPREGGDRTSDSSPGRPACFDPRPREGGDPEAGVGDHDEGVSIHAPARGATMIGATLPIVSAFRSTPPRGGRQERCRAGHGPSKFRSTPPRGGRRGGAAGRDNAAGFRSTPPRGGRRRGLLRRPSVHRVSIHAPARGATGSRSPSVGSLRVSIHAPARGATGVELRLHGRA